MLNNQRVQSTSPFMNFKDGAKSEFVSQMMMVFAVSLDVSMCHTETAIVPNCENEGNADEALDVHGCSLK
jgi:hypothetical protein